MDIENSKSHTSLIRYLKSKDAKWWELSYLSILALAIWFYFWGTTMLPWFWPPKMGILIYFLIMLYTGGKALFHNTFSKKEMMFAGIIISIFTVSAIISDYSFLFGLAFLIVGAKDVDFTKILKVYFWVGFLIMAICFLGSLLGFIPNLNFATIARGDRYSFGIISPTDFATHVFFLILVWNVINNRKISVPKILVLLFAFLFINKECHAQTGAICILLFAIYMCIDFFYRDRVNKIFLKVIQLCEYLFGFVAAGTILVMTWLYSCENVFGIKMNEVLSDRLRLNAEAFSKYGISLFGKYVTEVGNGRSTEMKLDYFFIDSSYVRIMIEHGLLVFLITLIIFLLIQRKAIMNNYCLLSVAIIFVCLNSIVEHHILDIAYNIFILALFAKVDVKEYNKKLECEKIEK